MENEEKERFAVIQEDWEAGVKPPELANALVKVSDILWADALIRAGKSRGIVCRQLEKEKAQELVNRLKALGMGAFLIPESELIKIGKAFNVTKLGCLPDVLLVSLESGGRKIYPAKWDDIIAISCGYVRQITKGKEDPSLGGLFGGIMGAHIPYLPVGGTLGAGLAFSMAAKSWTAEHTSGEKVDYLLFMDIIIKNPIARFRVESTHCAYAELGEKMKLDTLDNFKELMGEIVSQAPQACLGKGVKTLLGKTGEIQKITFPSLEEFDRYNAWLTQKAVHQPKQLEEKHQ
jgi:hypothetical protein